MQPIVTHVQTCYHTCASHVDSIKYHINGRIFKLEILRLDNPKACVFYSYFKKPVFWTTDPQDAKCAGITSSTPKAPRIPSNIPSHHVHRKLQGPSLVLGKFSTSTQGRGRRMGKLHSDSLAHNSSSGLMMMDSSQREAA